MTESSGGPPPHQRFFVDNATLFSSYEAPYRR